MKQSIQDIIKSQQAAATPAELLMMSKLIFRNIAFEFQYPVLTEKSFFTADFYIPSVGLLIEIDGGYHNRPDQQKRDAIKNLVYKSFGYNVLRIKNTNVDTFETLSIFRFKKKRIISVEDREFRKCVRTKKEYQFEKMKNPQKVK